MTNSQNVVWFGCADLNTVGLYRKARRSQLIINWSISAPTFYGFVGGVDVVLAGMSKRSCSSACFWA